MVGSHSKTNDEGEVGMRYDDLEWGEWGKHEWDPACRRSHVSHSLVGSERRARLNNRMELSEAIRSHGNRHTGLVALVATGPLGKVHVLGQAGYCDSIEDARSLMSDKLRKVLDGSWTPHANRSLSDTWSMMFSRWSRVDR